MDDRVRIRWACAQALKHDWFSKDYTAWADLRALEARLEAQTKRATRWWTDENDDDIWEQIRTERNLPQWQDIGCKCKLEIYVLEHCISYSCCMSLLASVKRRVSRVRKIIQSVVADKKYKKVQQISETTDL